MGIGCSQIAEVAKKLPDVVDASVDAPPWQLEVCDGGTVGPAGPILEGVFLLPLFQGLRSIRLVEANRKIYYSTLTNSIVASKSPCSKASKGRSRIVKKKVELRVDALHEHRANEKLVW